MIYKLTAEERETTINFCMASPMVEIDTADPRIIRILDKRVSQYPNHYKCVKLDDAFKAKAYTIDHWKRIRFGRPASQAQREAGRRKALFLHTEEVN